MRVLGNWIYAADRDATVRAYAKAPAGGADSCECADCRNFRVARSSALPAPFLALLDELGIDFRKDAEVASYGPLEGGGNACDGWYHFAGQLEIAGDFPPVEYGPGFKVSLCKASSPGLPIWDDVDSVLQLTFSIERVPWLLSEAQEEPRLIGRRSKPWFRRKRFGFGWTPQTWQGWAITFAPMPLVLALIYLRR